jgi:L-arabinose transport system substrate-binding protein
MRIFLSLVTSVLIACAGTLAGCDRGSSPSGASGAKIKIGFLVKQPDEPWFQAEWSAAEKAAAENGFELLKIGTPDGETVLAAIDNLAANGAKGFVICTPDVRLGPAIVAKAKANDLKVMTVDDQFVGPDGKVMADVPHLGVAARDVGHVSGQALADQFKQRKWPIEQSAACIVTFDELDTARERTQGIIEKLIENGFPKDRIFTAPQKTTDIPGAFDAANILLTQHGDVKYWLAAGMNDSATLGAVRALEGRSFGPDAAVAVGINGTDCIEELKKTKETPFYGSVLMEANVHGHDTAVAMYKWIAEGIEPAKTRFTGGVLITRKDFEQQLKAHGMWR